MTISSVLLLPPPVCLRLADGPDKVHRNQIGRLEIKRHRETHPRETGGDAEVLSLAEAERRSAAGLWPKPADFDA